MQLRRDASLNEANLNANVWQFLYELSQKNSALPKNQRS